MCSSLQIHTKILSSSFEGSSETSSFDLLDKRFLIWKQSVSIFIQSLGNQLRDGCNHVGVLCVMGLVTSVCYRCLVLNDTLLTKNK